MNCQYARVNSKPEINFIHMNKDEITSSVLSDGVGNDPHHFRGYSMGENGEVESNETEYRT